MKISSLLMCSALMSTNALAHSIVELESSYVEVSAINFQVKSKVFNVGNGRNLGVKAKYKWEESRNLDVEPFYQSSSSNVDKAISIDADSGLLSLNYNYPVYYKSATIKIKYSLGATYSNVNSKLDANYFVKLNFDGDLLKDNLKSSVYIINRKLDDNIRGTMTYGMKIDYAILRDIYMTFSGEKSGDIDIARLGFGMKF